MARQFFFFSTLALLVSGCGGDANTPQPTADASSEPLQVPEQSEPILSAADAAVVSLPAVSPSQVEPPPPTAFQRLCQAYVSGDGAGWSAAEKEVLEAGAASTPSLVVALTGGAEHERELASTMLAQIGSISPPAKKALRAGLNDDSRFVRANCAVALCAVGDVTPELLKSVEGLLDSEDKQTRTMAIGSVANLGPKGESLLTKVVPFLDDSDADLRRTAAMALGQFGSSGKLALEKLQSLASSDPESDIRQAATTAISLINGEQPQTVELPASGGTEVIPASSSQEVDK